MYLKLPSSKSQVIISRGLAGTRAVTSRWRRLSSPECNINGPAMLGYPVRRWTYLYQAGVLAALAAPFGVSRPSLNGTRHQLNFCAFIL